MAGASFPAIFFDNFVQYKFDRLIYGIYKNRAV